MSISFIVTRYIIVVCIIVLLVQGWHPVESYVTYFTAFNELDFEYCLNTKQADYTTVRNSHRTGKPVIFSAHCNKQSLGAV